MGTTVAAEEEVPESVVTNHVMARQIRGLFVSVLIPLLFRDFFHTHILSHRQGFLFQYPKNFGHHRNYRNFFLRLAHEICFSFKKIDLNKYQYDL
jgi:hypothetical protein